MVRGVEASFLRRRITGDPFSSNRRLQGQIKHDLLKDPISGSITRARFSDGGGAGNIYVRELQSNCIEVATKGLGKIPFGAPPEIIKRYLPDFFAKKGSIPSTIVLAKESLKNGHIQNEIEFPTYGSYFLAGKKLRIIGTPEQIDNMRAILQESLFGPENYETGKLEREHLKVKNKEGKSLSSVDDYVELIPLKNNAEIVIDGVKIMNLGEGVYRVAEDGVVLGNIDTSVFTPPLESTPVFNAKPFERPTFGITFLGTSSGFDPFGRTTSLILWAGKKGIFIDPLNDPVSEFNKLGIESKDVPYVLLTHCHADHDSGVLKRVLNGQRIKLITSKVIYESFLTKAKAYTGGIDIRHLIEFIEAEPGSEVPINGLKLKISSAFHSIPTIRFVAEYTEKKPDGQETVRSIAYSADTFFEKDKLKELYENGTLSLDRYNELIDFVLNCKADTLIHEAGMPPIHTPDKSLEKALIENNPGLLNNTVLVHTGKASEGVKLRVAKARETIELIRSKRSELEHLDAIASNPILANLSLKTAMELANNSQLVTFNEGEEIIKQGDLGDKFYIVVDGRVSVLSDSQIQATLVRGDYFGEAAILLRQPRNATIKAETSGRLLAVDLKHFQKVIESEELKAVLQRVLEIRPILQNELKIFQGLPSSRIAELSSKFQVETYKKGKFLIRQGQAGESFYIVKKGRVKVSIKDDIGKERLLAILGEGEVFGEISLLEGIPCTASVKVDSEEAEVLRMDRGDFLKLNKEIPGFTFNLMKLAKQRKS